MVRCSPLRSLHWNGHELVIQLCNGTYLLLHCSEGCSRRLHSPQIPSLSKLKAILVPSLHHTSSLGLPSVLLNMMEETSSTFNIVGPSQLPVLVENLLQMNETQCLSASDQTFVPDHIHFVHPSTLIWVGDDSLEVQSFPIDGDSIGFFLRETQTHSHLLAQKARELGVERPAQLKELAQGRPVCIRPDHFVQPEQVLVESPPRSILLFYPVRNWVQTLPCSTCDVVIVGFDFIRNTHLIHSDIQRAVHLAHSLHAEILIFDRLPQSCTHSMIEQACNDCPVQISSTCRRFVVSLSSCVEVSFHRSQIDVIGRMV